MFFVEDVFLKSTLSALGPRTSKMSKLDRARASMALAPPVLQTPALPSLPELDAYTAQMAFYPPYSAQPHMQGSDITFFFVSLVKMMYICNFSHYTKRLKRSS